MSAAVDLLTFGETMVSLRSTGPLSAGGSLAMHVAGAESNVAVGVARLGHSVTWAGAVGADPHGEYILRQLRSEGIGTQCRVDPSRSTGVMFLEQRTADVTRAFYYRAGSAGSTVSRDDVDRALSAGPRVLHLTGITPPSAPKPGRRLNTPPSVPQRTVWWSPSTSTTAAGSGPGTRRAPCCAPSRGTPAS
nr:PfkB family carbohydrate kinase [Pseudarthrobacter psychrotolerans]